MGLAIQPETSTLQRMSRVAPWLLWGLVVAACSTPVVDSGYVHDVVSGPFDDVKLTFGKTDVPVGTDAEAADGVADARADVVIDAAADMVDAVATDDAAGSDAAVDTAADVGPELGDDTAVAEVANDTGALPDIPGCVPAPETCNGVDDNCNGLTDESCDDGEPCTVNDLCTAGDCAGTLKNCSDGDACTADGCVSGNCQHTAYPCNDNNPCTADTCDPATGCTHPPLTTACDDGNPCTKDDSCATGVCFGTPDTCDDSNACTTDACTATGCTHTNNTATCDDGNPCTPSDVCTGGACVGSGGLCDDGNACTDDTCDGGTCGHVNNTGACSDGDGCTTGDACANGACVAGGPTNCDDGLTCTTDACAAGACTHTDTCPANNKCDSVTNACILTGCALPSNACGDGNQNRDDCNGARVIGRTTAKGANGYKKSDSTCSGLNYFNGGGGQCFDTGYDHTYRIFLRKGEVITVAYSGYTDDCWGGGSSDSTQNFEIIQASSGCGEPSSSDCNNYVKCTSKSSATYTAPAEGWFVIVADSQSWGADGYYYTLTVKLNPTNCQVAGCECP